MLASMPLPIRVTQLRRGDLVILEHWVRARTTPRRVMERAHIVLASAEGRSGDAICTALRVSRPTVTRWLKLLLLCEQESGRILRVTITIRGQRLE